MYSLSRRKFHPAEKISKKNKLWKSLRKIFYLFCWWGKRQRRWTMERRWDKKGVWTSGLKNTLDIYSTGICLQGRCEWKKPKSRFQFAKEEKESEWIINSDCNNASFLFNGERVQAYLKKTLNLFYFCPEKAFS